MCKLPKALLAILVLPLVALALGGCMDITGRGPAPLDKTLPEKSQTHPRIGHVYCMRGWLGIFSTGMDALAVRIDKEVGAPAVSVADEEWQKLRDFIVAEKAAGRLNGPLVLLGHSYGADDSIRVAQALGEKNISVDLLVLLDPVTPPAVSPNVKKVYCIYKSHPLTDWYPAWRGVPAEVQDKKTPLTNIDLRLTDVGFDTTPIDHINIEKTDGVHKMAMEQIKLVCPLRSDVAAGRTARSVTAAPAAAPTPAPAPVHAQPVTPTPAVIQPQNVSAVLPN